MKPRRNPESSRRKKQESGALDVTSTASSAPSVLAEARKLKQQAERKPEGGLRTPVLNRSAQLFQRALELTLSLSDQEEAWFDLADVLLLSSGSIQAGVSKLTGSPFNASVTKARALEMQLQASLAAANMSRQSHEMFERVCSMDSGGELKNEAVVNSGNALCDCAKLAVEIPSEQGGGTAVAAELYGHAFDRYRAALTSSPDDVDILMNMGDCCIEQAELPFSSANSALSTGWDTIKVVYERGLEAYASGCANADARKGDDLAGLLQNWGVGLFSFAQRSPDAEEILKLVGVALEKLRSAAMFQPTDLSSRLALGEGLVGVASHLTGKHLSSSSDSGASEGLELLKVAVEEGFGAVLRIDSNNINARLGMGDAHLAASKLLSKTNEGYNSSKHLEEAVNSYALAVKLLRDDPEGEQGLTFEEQCDALYNLACAAALAGREGEAQGALAQLVRVEAVPASDLIEDADLAGLHSKEWFVSLVQELQGVTMR